MLIIIISISLLADILLFYIYFKALNTLKQHNIVLKAIYNRSYSNGIYSNLILCSELVKRMESKKSTLFRLWDWGYKRILPKEDFVHIVGFIEE